jgi:hypothetical protein
MSNNNQRPLPSHGEYAEATECLLRETIPPSQRIRIMVGRKYGQMHSVRSSLCLKKLTWNNAGPWRTSTVTVETPESLFPTAIKYVTVKC